MKQITALVKNHLKQPQFGEVPTDKSISLSAKTFTNQSVIEIVKKIEKYFKIEFLKEKINDNENHKKIIIINKHQQN